MSIVITHHAIQRFAERMFEEINRSQIDSYYSLLKKAIRSIIKDYELIEECDSYSYIYKDDLVFVAVVDGDSLTVLTCYKSKRRKKKFIKALRESDKPKMKCLPDEDYFDPRKALLEFG